MLGPISDERFALLVNLGKKITDFNTKQSTGGEESLDDAHGINVQFDNESEDEDDEDVYGEINEDEMEDQEGEEAGDSSAIQAQHVSIYSIFVSLLIFLCNLDVIDIIRFTARGI